jgi:protein phosphatase
MGEQDTTLTDFEPGVEPGELESVRFAVRTDVGVKREENQDFYGIVRTDEYLIPIVADGMGGAKGGATASRTAIEVFENRLRDGAELDEEVVRDIIADANLTLYKLGSSDPTLTGMGTTFVGIIFTTSSFMIVNVGDSRAYRIRDGEIYQLTEDHTLINELIRSGALSEEQAENHPISHMLTRSLGPAENVQPDCLYSEDGPCGGDTYVLCSDGLYNHVGLNDIRDICIGAEDEEAAVGELVDLANARGGSDNITVIVVHFPNEFGNEALKTSPDTLKLRKRQTMQSALNGSIVHSVEDLQEENQTSPVLEGGVSVSALQQRASEDNNFSAQDEGVAAQVKETTHSLGSLKYFFIVLFSAIGASVFFSRSSYFSEELDSPIAKAPMVESTPAPSSTPAPTAVTEARPPVVVEVQDIPEQFDVPALPESYDPDASLDIEQISTDIAMGDQKALETEMSEQTDHFIERLKTLRLRIRAFDEPLSGRLSTLLTESEARLNDLNAELDDLRSNIDIATRRLAVWFGRRKRLQRMAPINLAAEVSVSSEEVRKQKDEFDRVTWELLKAEEERRYDPNNETLKARSADLSLQRKLHMNRLGVAIERAIDAVLTETDREITELSARRDSLERTRDRLVDDRSFARILLRGTQEEKDTLRAQYEKELEFIESDLANLSENL